MTVINCCQSILRNQFQLTMGLFDTSLGPALSFPKADSPFFQILPMNDNHWVLVHSNGADVITVYDSLYQGFISKSLARQCAAII